MMMSMIWIKKMLSQMRMITVMKFHLMKMQMIVEDHQRKPRKQRKTKDVVVVVSFHLKLMMQVTNVNNCVIHLYLKRQLLCLS